MLQSALPGITAPGTTVGAAAPGRGSPVSSHSEDGAAAQYGCPPVAPSAANVTHWWTADAVNDLLGSPGPTRSRLLSAGPVAPALS